MRLEGNHSCFLLPSLWFCYHFSNGQVAFSNLVFAIIKQPHFLHVFVALISSGHSLQIANLAAPNSFGPYLDGNAKSIGVTILTPSHSQNIICFSHYTTFACNCQGSCLCLIAERKWMNLFVRGNDFWDKNNLHRKS